jgi:hypothetical protein
MRHAILGTVVLGLGLAGAVRADMELNGAIATENFLGLRQGDFYNFRNANWFLLKVKANPSESVAGVANLELRNTNFTAVRLLDELWDRGTVEPVSWRVREAYVDYYGFLLDHDWVKLDLRAGKQVLGWGEADGFNPTNPLDPLDLENPLEMKTRLGNVSLKATLTVGEEWFSLEGVLVPRVLPSVLPVELFLGENPLDSPLMPRFELGSMLPAGLDLDLVTEPLGREVLKTATPAASGANVTGGLRLRWSLWDFDWTVSYARAREPIPAPRSVRGTGRIASTVEDGCPVPGRSCALVSVEEVTLVYPRIDVVGLNLRGGLGDVGVWAEVALIIPERLDTEVEVQLLGPQRLGLTAIEPEPFTKWVLGAEYTIPGGYYLNLQWIHGFFTEATGHRLHDYLFLSFRTAILNERLRFELNLGGELDTTGGRRALAGLLSALVTYKPFDGSEVALGYLMSRGERGTSFQMFEQLDQLYLRFRADF